MKIFTRITNISRFFVLFALVGIINGCGQQEDIRPAPKADFSFTKDPNCKAPCTVTFKSNSENARGYNWDFGDGTSETKADPVHVYKNGGTFKVTLTAAGDGGIDKITKEVTIGSTATRMVIKKVILEEFPMNNPNGSGWDINDGPDIYFRMTGPLPDTSTIFNARDIAYLNRTTNDLPLEWEIDDPFISMSPLTREFILEMWDLDFGTDTDDQMSFMRFKPESFIKNGTDNPYPAIIELEENGLRVILEVDWL